MRLFCAIGWHKASSRDHWNSGYYFSRCEACGRDLVRTVAGRWHVPKGYRVVWKSRYDPEPLQAEAGQWTAASDPAPIRYVARGIPLDFGQVDLGQVDLGQMDLGKMDLGIRGEAMGGQDMSRIGVDREISITRQTISMGAVPPTPASVPVETVAEEAPAPVVRAPPDELASVQTVPEPEEAPVDPVADEDDFMRDDADAWTMPPKPAPRHVERDFMDDPEDMGFGRGDAVRTDGNGRDDEVPATASAQEEDEAEVKGSKGRRGRKKAADTL